MIYNRKTLILNFFGAKVVFQKFFHDSVLTTNERVAFNDIIEKMELLDKISVTSYIELLLGKLPNAWPNEQHQ